MPCFVDLIDGGVVVEVRPSVECVYFFRDGSPVFYESRKIKRKNQ